MPIFFILILFFLSPDCSSQSLKGLWKGESGWSFSLSNTVSEALEIINENDTAISGIAHYYYTKNRFEHVKFHGKINWGDSSIVIIEDEIFLQNFDKPTENLLLGIIKLRINKIDSNYFISGKWQNKKRSLFGFHSLKIKYQKKISDTDSVFYNPENLKELNRIIDVQNLIELTAEESDSIKIAIYDNGEIDNDTATVYLNDSLIVEKQMLKANPIEFYISIDKTKPIQKIRLIACNLGSIPPNTAMLTITTRRHRYTINLSSNFSKNGTVEFFLKE